MYECYESFAAFRTLLRDDAAALDPAARLLVSEYCKYVLHRGWYYYPDALPEGVVATEQRDGHVDRALSFPVEDVYADASQPGQVGQEVYGAGAAFVLAALAFHDFPGAPFRLYATHALAADAPAGPQAHGLDLIGAAGCTALLAAVSRGTDPLPPVRLALADGTAVAPVQAGTDRIEFTVPADARLLLDWSGG